MVQLGERLDRLTLVPRRTHVMMWPEHKLCRHMATVAKSPRVISRQGNSCRRLFKACLCCLIRAIFGWSLHFPSGQIHRQPQLLNRRGRKFPVAVVPVPIKRVCKPTPAPCRPDQDIPDAARENGRHRSTDNIAPQNGAARKIEIGPDGRSEQSGVIENESLLPAAAVAPLVLKGENAFALNNGRVIRQFGNSCSRARRSKSNRLRASSKSPCASGLPSVMKSVTIHCDPFASCSTATARVASRQRAAAASPSDPAPPRISLAKASAKTIALVLI